MKMLIVLQIEASSTMLETIKRTGFSLVPDGANMQIKVPNSPSISKRKTKLKFVDKNDCSVDEIIQFVERNRPVES